MAETSDESAAAIEVRSLKAFPFDLLLSYLSLLLQCYPVDRRSPAQPIGLSRCFQSFTLEMAIFFGSCRRTDGACTPVEPPDIKNRFSSYDYESPGVPELVAGHDGTQ
uniref:Uncharacterized protein n=1 Tax=Oryza meridionalis TaxID=40149 RepID=A0A0E0DG68_9ORYZ